VVLDLLPLVRDIRRVGSSALDLCGVAAGRYDAYYERGLNPWDLAAGALVCERAGLELRELPATGALPSGLLAAPAPLADAIAPLVTA
jgi:myo-inositol-1(or 4)-monophosphatase